LDSKGKYFETTMWPHVRAAYNFARWLVRDSDDAEDIVQEAFTRAFEHLETFRGGDPRVWILAIVRNTAINMMKRKHPKEIVPWSEHTPEPVDPAVSVESKLVERSRSDEVRAAIEHLPSEFRETLILRDLEGLSYKEVAVILGVPMGTVMSRLSRARNLLIRGLMTGKEAAGDVSGS